MGLSSDSVALQGSRSDSPSEQSELIRRFPRPRTERGGEELGQELSRRVSQCSGYSVWNFTNPPNKKIKEIKEIKNLKKVSQLIKIKKFTN